MDPTAQTIVLSLIIALFITILFQWSKKFAPTLNVEFETNIGQILNFIAVLFALLLAFTVNGFWNRYFELRNFIIDEVNSLKIIYRFLKNKSGNQEVISNLKLFLENTIQEFPSLRQGRVNPENQQLYINFIDSVVNYADNNSTLPTSSSILDKIVGGEKGRELFQSKPIGYFFILIIVTAILTLIAFWFINFPGYQWIQFIINYVMIAIIVLVIVFMYNLSNPFSGNLINIDSSEYQSLLDEINSNVN